MFPERWLTRVTAALALANLDALLPPVGGPATEESLHGHIFRASGRGGMGELQRPHQSEAGRRISSGRAENLMKHDPIQKLKGIHRGLGFE